ncbi:hypothetical protein HY419_02295, partial [candidate division WWE3 bacterium]|nr:hypothetical protein [candidate division WWE3 bacterium]
KKVYIIDEVHMLTPEAFNALLKTLEEPPKHVIFILCTTEGHKVPDTIKSRCQVFRFKRAGLREIADRLEQIARKEKFKIHRKDLETIALSAYGSFRDADTMLEQVIEGNVAVKSLIGTSALDSFIKLTDALITHKTRAALSIVGNLYEEGVDLSSWAGEYVKFLRDLLYIQVGDFMVSEQVTKEVYASMEDLASKMTSSELAEIIDLFLKSATELKSSVIPQLPLELAAVSFSERGVAETPTETASLLKESEEKDSFAKDYPDDAVNVSLDSIIDKWSEILKEVKPFNHSVEALLRACRPAQLGKNFLVLEVAYAFHKERLEFPKNREIVEKVIANIFGSRIKLKCVLKHKEGEALTDKNVQNPRDEKVVRSALEVFDGDIVV